MGQKQLMQNIPFICYCQEHQTLFCLKQVLKHLLCFSRVTYRTMSEQTRAIYEHFDGKTDCQDQLFDLLELLNGADDTR